VVASLVNPQASFFGHLMGIAAGLLHCAYVAPALDRVQRARQAAVRSWQWQRGTARPRYAAAGAAGGSGGGAGARQGAGGPRPPAASGGQPAVQEGAPRVMVAGTVEELRQRRLQRFAGRA
jgi:hypothetical protein